MPRKPKTEATVAEASAPASTATPAAEPVKADVQTAVSPEAVDETLAKTDDRRRGMKPIVCMPVLYRDEREHNGQTDLAAIITGLPGDDAHGTPLATLYVMPPLGTPFVMTAGQWSGDASEQPARTWRFCF